MSGHSIKLHFCMFEISQRNHNSLDYHKSFLECFPSIAKFTCLKFDTNQKCFYMCKTLKPQEWTIFIFFTCHFFLPNVHHSFLIGENFNIDDYKGKRN